MTIIPGKLLRTAIVVLAGGAALIGDDGSPVASGSFISQSAARVGRPATPMSYAGVARRTTRRAAAYGAAGAAAAGAYYYYGAPGCQQVVNAYGRIISQCP